MWPDNDTDLDFLNFGGVAGTVAEIIAQAGGTARASEPLYYAVDTADQAALENLLLHAMDHDRRLDEIVGDRKAGLNVPLKKIGDTRA